MKATENPHGIEGREGNGWKLDHGGLQSGSFHDLMRLYDMSLHAFYFVPLSS